MDSFLGLPLYLVIILACVLAVLAIALIGILQRRYQDRDLTYGTRSRKHDSLKEVGILDIRPKEKVGNTSQKNIHFPSDSPPKTEEDISKILDEALPPFPSSKEKVKRHISTKEHDTESKTPKHIEVAKPVTLEKPKKTVPKEENKEQKPEPIATPQESSNKYLLRPLVQTIKSALEAHTVAILSLRNYTTYVIEAVASESGQIQRYAEIQARQYPLNKYRDIHDIVILDIKKAFISTAELGYYREKIPVNTLAIMPIFEDDLHWGFLLIDLVDSKQSFNTFQQQIIKDFGSLLSKILTGNEVNNAHIRKLRRQTLIENEISRARAENLPLAFILVCLNDQGRQQLQTVRSAHVAENDIREQLEKSIENHGRIERFGELTFGVFYYKTATEVESWMGEIQARLRNTLELSAAHVGIGATVLSERHTNGRVILDEAIDALEEVYDTGGGAIIV